jgi:hypothetical protein
MVTGKYFSRIACGLNLLMNLMLLFAAIFRVQNSALMPAAMSD